MRKHRITSRAGVATAAFLVVAALGACDFIEPTSVNPNTVPDATTDQLFTGIQVNTWLLAEGQLSRLSSMWTQQMTGTDRQFSSLDDYVFTEEDADDEWNFIYTQGGLPDLRDAIAKAEAGGQEAYAGVLKIYEAWQVGTAASIWGDVPYSEAGDPEIDQPALDDQAAVYTAVQTLLDEAIAGLASGTTGPGSMDMVFGGDTDAWTEVAYTLKARYHMHWAEANGTPAYEAAITAAENGVSTAAHNWTTVHSDAATENNLWYQFMRDRSGYISAGDYLVPLMNNGTPSTLGDDDPRIGIYFSLADCDGSDCYEARSSSLASSDGFGAPAWNQPIVTCAENNFILAEAYWQPGTAETEADAILAAQDALECQEDLYDVDLSAEQAAFVGLTGDALLEEIMEQKYTALFLNIESWNDYKRTCYPAITPKGDGTVPGRLYYGQQERQTNPNIPPPSEQPERNDNDPTACA